MRLELAERLICPGPHATTPLIVVAQETRGRDLLEAQLGCMTCHREGRIVGGSVDLGAAPRAAQSLDVHAATDEAVLRAAALLGLGEASTMVLLARQFAALAAPLAERHEAIVAVHGVTGPSARGVGHVQVTEERVPFTNGTFGGVALDASCSPALVADMLRCVRVGGRVLADADVPLPAGVHELARDARGWVGEVQAAAIVVPLRRA